MNMELKRRSLFLLPLAASGMALMPAAEANTREDFYSRNPSSEKIIGYIEGKVDLDYGVAAVYSSYVKSPICIAYSEGIGARLTLVNLLTGKKIKEFPAMVQGYDRPEAFITYSNRQVAIIGASGHLMHINSNNLQLMTYKKDSSPANLSVSGQLSNIAVGKSTWPNGLERSYVGDYDGRFCRFILPPNSQNPNANIWYSYGLPFSSGADIMSLAYCKGWVYLGIRGENAGIWRIREDKLDELANKGQKADISYFQDITPSSEDLGGLERSTFQPYQLTIANTSVGDILVARVDGNTAIRILVGDLKTETYGKYFSLSQICNIVGEDLVTRVKVQDIFYLIKYNLLDYDLNEKYSFVGISGYGSLSPDVPVFNIGGTRYVVSSWQEGVVFSPLLAQGKVTSSDLPSPRIIGSESFSPAERTQIKHLAYFPPGKNSISKLAVAPYWINDPRIGVIDSPEISLAETSARIIKQTFHGMKNYHSVQVESMAAHSRGLLSLGTYTHACAQLLDLDNVLEPGEKFSVQDFGDSYAARLVCQKELPDGNVVFGSVGKFDNNPGGIALLKVEQSGSQKGRLLALPASEVVPNQNITSIETGKHTEKIVPILLGSSSRLESSKLSQGIDPVEDAVIVVQDYSIENHKFDKIRKIIKLPEGIKSVWKIKRIKSGRIFVLAHYGASVKVNNGAGKFVPDAQVLLELDPVTFDVLEPSGGKGYYIRSTSRTVFSHAGDIEEMPNGQLVVRTNIFIYMVTLDTVGVGAITPLAPQAVDFSVGNDGEIYTASYDGYIRRLQW